MDNICICFLKLSIMLYFRKGMDMNLRMAPIGVEMKIMKIKIDGEQKKLLANMGFVEEAKIIVVSENAGNLIVNIKDSRVGIGADIAQKIMVVQK